MGARLRSQIRGNSVSTLTMNLTTGMRLGVRFPSLHYQLVAITELSQLTCCFRMVDSQTWNLAFSTSFPLFLSISLRSMAQSVRQAFYLVS